MSREAHITPADLEKYLEDPNLFWRAFEPQYIKMFRPLHSLIEQEELDNWFVEYGGTLDRLANFVSTPNAALPGLLILRGWTGSGKTTSVRVLFEKLQERLPDEIVYLYVDTSVASVTVEYLERDFDTQIYSNLKKQFGDNHFPNVSPGDESDTANRARLNLLINEGKTVVAVWDNADQCPRNIQQACLQLAHHKLNWIRQQKIIVPIREYTFYRARTELSVAAFEYTVIRHIAPPISEVLKRRAGLAQKAIHKLGEEEKTINLGEGIEATLGDGNKFLSNVIDDLGQADTFRALRSLSNSNVRVQLDMTRYALRSPYLTRELVLDSLRAYYERTEPYILIPIHQFIEGLLTVAMDRCYRVFSFEDALLINMFDAGEPETYYNTVNMHHVAQIVAQVPNGVEVERVVSELETLGHSRSCTENTLREFLACGIFWSEQGSAEDFPGEISKVTPTDATTYYLQRLMRKLVYLQHMGLVTPLEESFRTGIEVWATDEQSTTFSQRMTAAQALVRQIASDETAEVDFAKRSVAALRIMKKYQFGNLSGSIARHVLDELWAIRGSTAAGQKGIGVFGKEWVAIMKPFQEISKRNPGI